MNTDYIRLDPIGDEERSWEWEREGARSRSGKRVARDGERCAK
jgi:hypothetical protein